MSINEPSGGEGIQPSPTMVNQPPAQQMIKALVSAPTNAGIKSKENSYAKPGVGKCYKCGEPGHKFNECPQRKQVNMADYRDDEGVVIEETSDSDFTE